MCSWVWPKPPQDFSVKWQRFESAGVEKNCRECFLRGPAVFDSLPPAGVDAAFPQRSGTICNFFPVVGLILGLILVLVNFLLLAFASAGLLSVILVTLLAFMTRGLHLDGLGDTFDGLGAGGERERVLSVMDDSHIGVFGLIAIVLVLFLRFTPSRAWTLTVGGPCW